LKGLDWGCYGNQSLGLRDKKGKRDLWGRKKKKKKFIKSDKKKTWGLRGHISSYQRRGEEADAEQN